MTSIPNSENINTWISELNSDAKAAISVDCVIFGYNEKELSVLQIECNMPPHEAKMSLIGDLVKSYETVDEAANRILEKITGLSDLYLEQVQTFSDPNRHPLGRVISVAYYSLIKTDKYELIDKEHKHLRWVPITSTEEMAFDHQQIMNLCYNRLKKRLRERPVGFSLLPKKFTLIQLQRLYEIILGIELDKINFRRKLKATGLLKDLGEVQQDVSHRPAKLYTFDYERYAEMENSNVLKFDI
jgi:8-oxo-dGTP diphosphatase